MKALTEQAELIIDAWFHEYCEGRCDKDEMVKTLLNFALQPTLERTSYLLGYQDGKESIKSPKDGGVEMTENNNCEYDFPKYKHPSGGLRPMNEYLPKYGAGEKTESYPAEFVEWCIVKKITVSPDNKYYAVDGFCGTLPELFKYWQENINK